MLEHLPNPTNEVARVFNGVLELVSRRMDRTTEKNEDPTVVDDKQLLSAWESYISHIKDPELQKYVADSFAANIESVGLHMAVNFLQTDILTEMLPLPKSGEEDKIYSLDPDSELKWEEQGLMPVTRPRFWHVNKNKKRTLLHTTVEIVSDRESA